MKAIRIEAYMESAQFAVKDWRGAKHEITYPLPPYSTVIGMVHKLCGWTSYHDMNVSVSGTWFPPHVSKEVRWKGGAFAKTETEEFKKRFPVRVEDGRGYTGWVQGPIISEELNDLTLLLHIVPINQEDIDTIYNSLLYPPIYPSLGRHSDLLRIDKIDIVDINEELKEVETTLAAYVPCKEIYNICGTVFNLHKNYIIKNKRRIFNDVHVFLVSSGIKVQALTDPEGLPVFFA